MPSNDFATKPVEYFISRATDPFLEDGDRKAATAALCEKVNSEAEAAQIAVNVLGHKLLTPNQDEAMHALETVEALVQKCGSKVHTKVGKYRFLNQMVKLVSYKHHGASTSHSVREKAIFLLYSWQRSMRHIDKFKEVYENLREHNVIPADPEVAEDDIPTIPPPTPKLAVFEDEEKAELLKQLLKSNNPEDLQAANRLIKSLVRTEDIKLERANTRLSDLESAARACESMQHLLFEHAHQIATTADDYMEKNKIKSVFESLENARPMLYRYASEAAEKNEEILSQILALNDQVNRVMQQYQSVFGEEDGKGKERRRQEECGDLLGGELTFEQELAAATGGGGGSLCHQALPPRPLSSSTHSSSNNDDVPFIGLASLMDNVDATKSKSSSKSDVLSDLTTLLDGGKFSPAKNHISPARTIDILSGSSHRSSDKNDIFSFPFEKLENAKPTLRTATEGSHIPSSSITLRESPPVLVISREAVLLIGHVIDRHPLGMAPANGSCVLLTFVHFSTRPFLNVQMKVTSKTEGVSTRLLEPTSTHLDAFSPSSNLPSLQQILVLQPILPAEKLTSLNCELTLNIISNSGPQELKGLLQADLL